MYRGNIICPNKQVDALESFHNGYNNNKNSNNNINNNNNIKISTA